MIDFIENLARQAGEICLEHNQGLTGDDLDFKGSRDLVTVVDQKVEDFITSAINSRYPRHDVLGEERGASHRQSEYRWIIDPIDGTTSYFHRQPFYSVSIALEHHGRLEAGVVYGPALGQMFTAVRGEGAWLNGGERLSVSTTTAMIDTVMATGFACLRAGREPNNLHYLAKILPEIRDFRRCGSAALDLAYVAAGKVDAFWEMDLNIYDVAAGVLLVEEAGGRITDMQGGSEYPHRGIVAANTNAIHERMIALFSR